MLRGFVIREKLKETLFRARHECGRGPAASMLEVLSRRLRKDFGKIYRALVWLAVFQSNPFHFAASYEKQRRRWGTPTV
ncbi:unnamed protein product [Chondrus crispus]|uniref:Uncharacterized protein n=1 Tax=Chondrus crispus TaxID=2769 RepID=R7QDW1_CHOCR|nr:unnamed protein product [Chondrus crispus]CDF36274.1 unnamed protein product [Chondrus crispus]|eukprot:XP_005716093.1 unnamed protein product [Chondrus crispus]